MPCVFERLHQVLQFVQRGGVFLAQQFAHALGIDPAQVALATRGLHLRFQVVQPLQFTHQLHRLGQRERFIAGHAIARAIVVRPLLRDVLRQFGQVYAHAVVADELIHHVLQLLALFFGHRIHHGLHLR
jgi:hypothetical protein